MALKKRDFQKLVNFIKEFQSRLPCGESAAELRDSLNLSLLHMHKFYKRVRVRCLNGPYTLDGSLSLSGPLNGTTSPVSPFISPVDRFSWRWLNLDVGKLSASFGHGDNSNFVPEIFYAIKDCDIGQMEKLLQKDKDSPNELDAIGRTTAMYATNGGSTDHLNCLKFLIARGVDLNHQSNDGFTCLHIACHYGYDDFIDTLLQTNVNIDTQDADGRTPLHFAAAYCSQEMLQKLVLTGADPSVQDGEGLTAAMWACHFDQLENLQLLLAAQERSNVSPEARFQSVDNLGRTILHWAVSRTTNINCMKVLLNAETAHLCDDEGKTVFLYAAENGCVPACEEILNLCSEDVLEETDDGGRTALHLAAMGGHGEVVDFLLSKGAVSDRKDNQGASPFDFVTSRNLNYCSLVLTSYQRYREKLSNMHAKLVEPRPADPQHKENKSQDIGDEMKAKTFAIDDQQAQHEAEKAGELVVDHESEAVLRERSNSIEVDNKSLKIDCQDIVGFEVEGDIEEDDEMCVQEIESTDQPRVENADATKYTVKPESWSNSPTSLSAVLDADGTSYSKAGGDIADAKRNLTYDPSKRATLDSRSETKMSDANADEENLKDGKQVERSIIGMKGGSNLEVPVIKKEVVPPEEMPELNDFEEEEYEFEDVSLGLADQKIVLVGLHEGDNGFEIDGVNDLEFEDAEDHVSLDQGLENQVSDAGETVDILRVDNGQDQDLLETSRLSPRIESVTGLMETNTVPANHSASVNMSVSSLRSDSDEEDAQSNTKERISKLDSKLPMQPFDERPLNQLEYRDPFSKVKPAAPFEEGMSRVKRNEETRAKTSHSKRKDKKESQKSKPSSPKGKQDPASPGPSRIHLGPLEPMKPLQPIIPPQGFQGNRGGSQGQFPEAFDSMLPVSSRSPVERSNALSSPVESPRSKGNQLPSPRGGFDSRDTAKLSHIPRPTSPSNRNKQFASNSFPPRPPVGR
ncbi:ankycorbin-like [Rhopilema esculentum]|uniref:ankycorbin-like n=1 Tax=Rhopilema esculentum TaxID=499914 RepID=UPI0031E34B4D